MITTLTIIIYISLLSTSVFISTKLQLKCKIRIQNKIDLLIRQIASIKSYSDWHELVVLYGFAKWTQLSCSLNELDWHRILALGVEQHLLSQLSAIVYNFSGIFLHRYATCKIPCRSITCLHSSAFKTFQDTFSLLCLYFRSWIIQCFFCS